MDAFILLGTFFGLMIIGMPVAYAMGLAALVGAWWIDIPLDAVMIQIAAGVNKFSLLAIPFFVLAGAIMAEGGMARRLVAFANVLVGFIRGGLSLVNILASTFFGAISGSSMADTASVGSVLILGLAANWLAAGLLARRLDGVFQARYDAIETLLGQESSYKLSETARLKQKLVLYPGLGNSKGTRAALDAGLQVDLNKTLSLTVKLQGRYDGLAEPPAEKYDVLFMTGLSIRFGG